MIEIELKYAVDSQQAMRQKILQLGATSIGLTCQKDNYFDHPLHQLQRKDHALRIREADGKFSLDFKGANLDTSISDTAKIRPESEVEIANESAANELSNLLGKLGFHSAAVVSKEREVFKFPLADAEVSLCLDEVVGDRKSVV